MKLLIALILTTLSTGSFAQEIRLKNSSTFESVSVSQMLVIIDGKVMPRLVKSKTDSTQFVSPLSNLEDNQIQDMTVLKGPDAIAAFGDAGKHGVVKVNMRKKSSN